MATNTNPPRSRGPKQGFLAAVAMVSIAVALFYGAYRSKPIRAPLSGTPNTGPAMAYFVGESTPTWLDPLSVSQVITSLELVTINEWNDIQVLASEREVRALIVDDQTYDQVDWDWTAHRMRKGMVLAGVRLTASDLVTNVLNPSLEAEFAWWTGAYSPTLAGLSGERFSVVSSWVAGTAAIATAAALEPYYSPDEGGMAARDSIFEDAVDKDAAIADNIAFFTGTDKFYRILAIEVANIQLEADNFDY